MEDVQEEPLFVQRVAGLDIAKAEVEVTIRVPSDTGSGRRPRQALTAPHGQGHESRTVPVAGWAAECLLCSLGLGE